MNQSELMRQYPAQGHDRLFPFCHCEQCEARRNEADAMAEEPIYLGRGRTTQEVVDAQAAAALQMYLQDHYPSVPKDDGVMQWALNAIRAKDA